MLSEEYKKDVTEHITEYSLDDIEAKLSVICVRTKVSFDLDDSKVESIQITENFFKTEESFMRKPNLIIGKKQIILAGLVLIVLFEIMKLMKQSR